MMLHEVELYPTNPENGKSIFQNILGLKLNVDNLGLFVYDPGH